MSEQHDDITASLLVRSVAVAVGSLVWIWLASSVVAREVAGAFKVLACTGTPISREDWLAYDGVANTGAV